MAAAEVAVLRTNSNNPGPLRTSEMTSATKNANLSSALHTSSQSKASNAEGATPLMLACQQGRHEEVAKLLKKKPSTIKETTRSGKVALHFCAEAGSVSCTEVILGSDPSLKNAQDEEGYTPLHLAVINGNKDVVQKLIGAGAALDCMDNENHSLVHWATVCGEVEILDLLLSSGAPASTPDIHVAHPLHYAAQMCGSPGSGGPVSRARVQSTVYGVSPKKGLQILKRLIQFGCPVDVRDQDGRQPLLWAASAGSSDAILMLVNAGAKVDAEDRDGLTALHCAASRGHTDCLETLIGLCGAEVDLIDNNGCTALFYAVTLGHADCTELLLKYGSEPNRQDRKGRTPAHCGAAKGQLETLKLLAKHDGNLWIRNVRGDLPLHEAVLSRRKDLVVWLLSQKHEAVNTPNNDGRCPIHLAALNNNVEMVKILIDHRADVNLLMRSGKGAPMTPLDAAIHKGNSAVAKFLQLHGGLPSNSLNDAALIRRLNRSVIEGQISPASSLHGSHLGSQHHPTPDDPHRPLISPDGYDRSQSMAAYSRTDFSKAGSHPPHTVAPTPIADDACQTDSRYVKDSEVQVSDSFEESSRTTSNNNGDDGGQKKDRRRRKKSRSSSRHEQNKGRRGSDVEYTTSPSPERKATNSRKSSRRSVKGSGSTPRSKAESTRVTPEKKIPEEGQNELLKTAEDSEEQKGEGVVEDTEHEHTLSDKCSELENVGTQSSETDAREEELVNHAESEEQNPVEARNSSKDEEEGQEEDKRARSKNKNDAASRVSSGRSKSAKSDREASSARSGKSPSSSAATEREANKEEQQKTKQHMEAAPPQQKKKPRSRSKSASVRNKIPESGNKSSTRDRSKSAGSRTPTPHPAKDVSAKPKQKQQSDEDVRNVHKSDEDLGDAATAKETTERLDEIEAGRAIDLQEAARRRKESLARSRSISITRPSCTDSSAAENSPVRKDRLNKPQQPKGHGTSEEREIQLQEALLASSNKLRPPDKGKDQPRKGSRRSTLVQRQSVRKSTRIVNRSSEEREKNAVFDSGVSGMMTSTSDEHRNRSTPQSKQYVSVKRRTITRRAGSGTPGQRKSIFSSSPKQYRLPQPKGLDARSYETLVVHQMSYENLLDDDAYSTSTRGSVTSEEAVVRDQPLGSRRKKPPIRPRSKLTFSRNENPRASPRPKKPVDIETPISVTQAMQASMRKYNLERMIFHELLELKRLQIRAGKANEQLLVKRLAENYKRAGFSVNFRDFEGPFTFRNFEKYLYDQLRLLQNNRKVLPRFAPSDDIEKLTVALKKMNSAKLPYLEDAERSESVCDNIQCSHATHRCHHAAHAYTGVPCAAYIGNRKPNPKDGFLPKVNPLRAPGPTQKDPSTRAGTGLHNFTSPMQISISPRTDTQSPITLEVQQGSNTQVFTLPTKSLDPMKNYYVSLSIKPNAGSPQPSPSRESRRSHPSPADLVDDGSISAPPPPLETGSTADVNLDREIHNQSM